MVMNELLPGYHLSVATEEDAKSCMDLAVPIFNQSSFGRRVIGGDSPTTHDRAAALHIDAWRDHEQRYSVVGIGERTIYPLKITYVDPSDRSKQPKVVAYAEWYICPRERTAEEIAMPLYLHHPDNVAVDLRDEFEELVRPFVEARKQFMKNEPHALLMYLCVSPDHRRKGLAAACVRWGMDRCAELKICGYLTSSEEGKFVYSSLGWQTVGSFEAGGGTVAVMTWRHENHGYNEPPEQRKDQLVNDDA